jgi:hypothetical protein
MPFSAHISSNYNKLIEPKMINRQAFTEENRSYIQPADSVLKYS